MKSSEYINEQRRDYSLYVLQSRAIPHAADGLKAAARRIMWMARDGKKQKSAVIAGQCMPIHPHASPESAVNTLAAKYGNNIRLLNGNNSFGTILNPTAYGASRYTSVETSKFANDVVYQDIEIVPMQENYDGTLEEPKHFLPLIPVVLLNPQQGIAVGFASDILPRSLADIIHSQIQYLNGDKFKQPKPTFVPTDQKSIGSDGNRWQFVGKIERLTGPTIRVTQLPYGLIHSKFIDNLTKLEEIDDSVIVGHKDGSKDTFNIVITFKKGILNKLTDNEILQMLGLMTSISENLNVIDFDGKRVWAAGYSDIIEKFCDWRLTWYKVRYQRLATLLNDEMQRYKDVLLAIKKGVSTIAHKINSRIELKEYLTELGIINIDYIADLPVYRFTEDEKHKVEVKLKEAEEKMKEYKLLLKDEKERRKVFIAELQETLLKYNKGYYDYK
jgi:DNA gyrase subunit A